MTTLPHIQATIHLKQLQTLLKKGYTSQLLFCTQVPPILKIPSLISCNMYQQATIQLLKQQPNSPLHLLWLVACCHMIEMNYDQYYQKLKCQKQVKYKQLADDWIKMNKPLCHPPQVKTLLRKKFQQLLLLGQQQNYFTNPKMPVFLVSCSWLQKFYNDNLTYIPAVDNSDLFQPMPWIQTQPRYLHYNYRLKQQCRQNIHYKILPYQAWQFLYTKFGGMEFRRFTTDQRQPICELVYHKVKIMIVQQRYMYGFQIFQLLVSRYDTIALIIERIKRIMISYGFIQFQSLKSTWEPIIISHLQPEQFIDIIQDQNKDIIKQAIQNDKCSFTMERLEYDHDIEDSQYNYKSDILVFNLEKNKKSFIDLHSIPYKKTIKKYNKCLTCNTTQRLQQCVCKQAYFCCKECRLKNKQHIKNCQNLMKQDAIVARLISLYNIHNRNYSMQQLKDGGKVGLQNLGNTCYMNAALQCVLSVDILNQFFMSNQHIKQLNVTNVLGSEGHLACSYAELVKDYYFTNRRSLQPIKILKIISSKNAQFRGYNHQDSQEFFNYFFDKLHQDLNRVKNKPYTENIESDGRPDSIISQISWKNYQKRNNSFISDNFAGQYRSEIKCPDCSRISITFDPFLSVTLPFPKQEEQMLLSGYFVSKEGQYKKIEKYVKPSMSSQEFISRYFHENVFPIWLRHKQPYADWKPKKNLQGNNKDLGVLIFYEKPENSTVQLQISFQKYQTFHRKTFSQQIKSQEDLKKILYRNIKVPLLKATKNQALLTLSTDQYLKTCEQSDFLQIVSKSFQQYPIIDGIIKIKAKINQQKLPKQWTLQDKIKFDVSSKSYEPKQNIKAGRSISDRLSVQQLIKSFSEPQQLTQDNAWYCSKCKDHKLAQKMMSIYRTPKYLVLHLKRFNHRGNRYVIYGQKVKTPISLQQYEIINGQKYQLFGVVNHYGSLSMGHYTAFVKRSNEWYYADDSSFKRRPLDGDGAYLLFYKRAQGNGNEK